MKLVWCSDVHLDCLYTHPALVRFANKLCAADAAIITGDIGLGPSVLDYLTLIRKVFEHEGRREIQLYYVLGNHDTYKSSIADVRAGAAWQSSDAHGAVWLGAREVVRLTDETCLIGVDGWYDGTSGDYWGTRMDIVDFVHIKELSDLIGKENILPGNRFLMTDSYKARMLPVLTRLAVESATDAERKLRAAIAAGYKKVIFATHVPPFVGAAWHLGRQSDTDALPFFSNATMGKVIVDVMQEHEDVECTVLCGHSHSRGTYTPIPNVTVHTAYAEYGSPDIERMIDVE